MDDKLDFSLPEKKEKERKTTAPRAVILLLTILLLLSGVTILALLLRGLHGQGSPEQTGLSSEKQKELALKLEQRTLNSEAARAWEEYLKNADLSDSSRAKIYYRLGKVYSERGEWERAIANFYRSEVTYRDTEIANEINRLVQECFENLGKFSALSYELQERTSALNPSQLPGEEVVAEIGIQKITKGELDAMIEEEVGMQLKQFAAHLSPEEQKKQKEALLTRYKSPEARVNTLNRFIVEEILYRKAKEKGLDQEKETMGFLRSVEKKILAQKLIETEFKEQIRIGDTDLETYYEAHKEEYMTPERAKISRILVKDEETANEVLKKLKEGENFEDLAQHLSGDGSAKEKKEEIESWVEKGKHDPVIGYSADASGIIFSTPAGEVANKYVKTDKGYYILKVTEREPARQKEFAEVRQEVFRELRRKKEEEIQQNLFRNLKEKYGVVIHQGRLKGEGKSSSEEEKLETKKKSSGGEEKKLQKNSPGEKE